MLEQAFNERVYQIQASFLSARCFGRFQNREASLTTVETFCMEIIHGPGAAHRQRVRHLCAASRPPTPPTRSTAWSRRAMCAEDPVRRRQAGVPPAGHPEVSWTTTTSATSTSPRSWAGLRRASPRRRWPSWSGCSTSSPTS